MTGKILYMILNTKFGLSGIDADYSKKAVSSGYHQLRSFQCCHFFTAFPGFCKFDSVVCIS